MSGFKYYEREIDGKVIYGWKRMGEWKIGPFLKEIA